MTQIAQTDSALIRLLENCGFPGVDIASGPHEWDNGYLQRLLASAPAIRVVFKGAEQFAGDPSTTLNLNGTWACYVVVGWNGQDEQARRLGAGAGYDLLGRAASVLHSAILTDENGDRLPTTTVTVLDVLADSSLDISNLWVAGIEVSVELPLELPEDCVGPLDDFLKVHAGFDLPGAKPAPAVEDAGDDADVPLKVDLPQT